MANNTNTNPTGGMPATTKVITPKFRVSFPSVFSKRKIEGQTDEQAKYSVQMLFKKTDDISSLKNAVRAAVVEKWGADSSKWPKGITMPFRDGTEKDYDGYGPDVTFVSASSKMKPRVVGPDMQDIIEPSEFYGGCYARASINAFAWEYMGKRGVSFGLRNIQKMADGEPFGGGSSPEADFQPLGGTAVTGAKSESKAEEGPLGL
jgi:hypothetical protein